MKFSYELWRTYGCLLWIGKKTYNSTANLVMSEVLSKEKARLNRAHSLIEEGWRFPRSGDQKYSAAREYNTYLHKCQEVSIDRVN
jgi:hypothetical protein